MPAKVNYFFGIRNKTANQCIISCQLSVFSYQLSVVSCQFLACVLVPLVSQHLLLADVAGGCTKSDNLYKIILRSLGVLDALARRNFK